jgi:hypothetical protein
MEATSYLKAMLTRRDPPSPPAVLVAQVESAACPLPALDSCCCKQLGACCSKSALLLPVSLRPGKSRSHTTLQHPTIHTNTHNNEA